MASPPRPVRSPYCPNSIDARRAVRPVHAPVYPYISLPPAPLIDTPHTDATNARRTAPPQPRTNVITATQPLTKQIHDPLGVDTRIRRSTAGVAREMGMRGGWWGGWDAARDMELDRASGYGARRGRREDGERRARGAPKRQDGDDGRGQELRTVFDGLAPRREKRVVLPQGSGVVRRKPVPAAAHVAALRPERQDQAWEEHESAAASREVSVDHRRQPFSPSRREVDAPPLPANKSRAFSLQRLPSVRLVPPSLAGIPKGQRNRAVANGRRDGGSLSSSIDVEDVEMAFEVLFAVGLLLLAFQILGGVLKVVAWMVSPFAGIWTKVGGLFAD